MNIAYLPQKTNNILHLDLDGAHIADKFCGVFVRIRGRATRFHWFQEKLDHPINCAEIAKNMSSSHMHAFVAKGEAMGPEAMAEAMEAMGPGIDKLISCSWAGTRKLKITR
jgi:hypothetical protein